MIRDHIPQGSGRIVITAAKLDAELFGNGDLNVVDEIAVPDRLKDAVAKPEDQDVLYGLFAEIMIDAVDLALLENLQQVSIEIFGRFEIVSERFFKYEAPPITVLFVAHPVLDDLLRTSAKRVGGVAI